MTWNLWYHFCAGTGKRCELVCSGVRRICFKRCGLFLLVSSACKYSQYFLVPMTNLYVFLFGECRWQFLFTGLFLSMSLLHNSSKMCTSCLCPLFSSGQCHQSGVMQQEARTFLWWFYSSLRSLLVQCHQVSTSAEDNTFQLDVGLPWPYTLSYTCWALNS